MPYQQHNAYAYTDVSQNTIHYKMTSYLTSMSRLEGQTRSTLINSNGDCNGWSFLFAYYNSINKSAEFKDILSYMSTWNGKISSLHHDTMPQSLKSKYNSGIQVFEQTINDLSWFSQTRTQHISNFQISQHDRIKQFNLVTDNKYEIKKVFDFLQNEKTNITSQELPDMLRIAHQWKEAWLDLGVYSSLGGHALSVYLNQDGSYTYYDCNEKNGAFTSFRPEEISAQVMKSIGLDTVLNDFSLYKLNVKEPSTFEKQPLPTSSLPESKIVEPLNVSFKTASKFIDMAIKSHDLDPIHTLLSNDSLLTTKLLSKYAKKLVDTALNDNHSELTKLILEKHYHTKPIEDKVTQPESTDTALKISDFLSWDVANTFYKLTQGTLGETATSSVKSTALTLGDCFSCEESQAVNFDSGETAYIAPSITALQPDNAIHLVASADIF